MSDEDDYPVLMHYVRTVDLNGRECLVFHVEDELSYHGMPKTLIFGRKLYKKSGWQPEDQEVFFLEV